MPPNRVPIVSTGNPKKTTIDVPRQRAAIGPGMRVEMRFAAMMTTSAPTARLVARGDQVRELRRQELHPRQEVTRHRVDAQAEEIADLRAGNEDRDAVGETDDDRTRNEAHGRSQAGRAQHDEHHAGHQRADEQPLDPVARDDAGDDDDEGARRTANLQARAAQERDDAAGHDGRIDAGLRGQSRRDGEGQRQGQRDEAHRDAGRDVGDGLGAVVVMQRRQDFGAAGDAAERAHILL